MYTRVLVGDLGLMNFLFFFFFYEFSKAVQSVEHPTMVEMLCSQSEVVAASHVCLLSTCHVSSMLKE